MTELTPTTKDQRDRWKEHILHWQDPQEVVDPVKGESVFMFALRCAADVDRLEADYDELRMMYNKILAERDALRIKAEHWEGICAQGAESVLVKKYAEAHAKLVAERDEARLGVVNLQQACELHRRERDAALARVRELEAVLAALRESYLPNAGSIHGYVFDLCEDEFAALMAPPAPGEGGAQ